MADVTAGAPATARGRLGRAAQRFIPDLDQWAYFRARRADMRSRAASGEFDQLTGIPASVGRSSVTRDLGRNPHVVVIPDEGREFTSWGPGHRNFYYEAAQNLGERTSDTQVSVFHVARGESPASWQRRLLDHLNDHGATHVLTHIESDPGTAAAAWTWDTGWSLLSERWDGVLLGGMFDSAYRHTLLKARLLARISPRFMLVDICMPMDGELVKGRTEVGPVNMPMSDESLALLDARLADVPVEHDLSFVGVLYPYRVELIDRLRAEGITVAVNPHRHDEARTRSETLANQPGWLEYMAGLAGSRATLNFSASAARPVEQLKTRVIEAGLAGTLLLTDDHERTRLFWTAGVQYGEFHGVDDLATVARTFLDSPARADAVRRSFAERARELARFGYWQAIDEGLVRRGLPSASGKGVDRG